MIQLADFQEGAWFVHSIPGATLEVRVLKIHTLTSESCTMAIEYRQGKTDCLKKETVSIGKEDLPYWAKSKEE